MPIDFSFLEDNAPQKEEAKKGCVNVTIRVDADCLLKCDGEEILSQIRANDTIKIQLSIGQHLLEFISIVFPTVRIDKQVCYTESEINNIVIIDNLSELIKKQPIINSINGLKIEFSNVDKNDNIIDNYGSELIYGTLKYLQPRITYYSDLLSNKEITIYPQFINPDNSIDKVNSKKIIVKPGNNSVELLGWGSEKSDLYSIGTYKYQLWLNDSLFYETKFTVKNITDFIHIKQIEFANVDENKNIINDYGSELIDDAIKYLNPRITYSSSILFSNTVITKKIIGPTTSYVTTEKVTFLKSDEEKLVLGNLKNEYGAISFKLSGEYKYQLWHNNKMLYEKKFVIKESENLINITSVKIAAFHGGFPDSKLICDFGSTIKQARNKNDNNYIDYLLGRFYYKTNITGTIYKHFRIHLILPNGDCKIKNIVRDLNHNSEFMALNIFDKNDGNLEYGPYTLEIYCAGHKLHSLEFSVEKRDISETIFNSIKNIWK